VLDFETEMEGGNVILVKGPGLRENVGLVTIEVFKVAGGGIALES
jgi:hypothetical protein